MTADEARRRYRAQKSSTRRGTARQMKGGQACALKRRLASRAKLEAMIGKAGALEEAAAAVGWKVSTAKSHLRRAFGSSQWPVDSRN